MIHYKDMTFCSAPCKSVHCLRNFTDRQRTSAKLVGLPVAFSDFSKGCADYVPDEKIREMVK